MTTRKRLVIGNWKMHGNSECNHSLVEGLVQGLQAQTTDCELVICPSYVHLADVARWLQPSAIALGAQNVCEHVEGAFTGEVSAAMLAELGVRFVLLGHSERRTFFGDDDARVAHKFALVAKLGLTPVLCVGESLQQRESGHTERVILGQLERVLQVVDAELWTRAVVAYEPIWAIGTGRTASCTQAQQVHRVIRDWLGQHCPGAADQIRILYGGSVNADNAAGLFAMPDIDGGLIGGASLNVESFLEIGTATT